MEIPFDREKQIHEIYSRPVNSSENGQLPGQPRISLGPFPEPLYQYLEEDLCTRELDLIASKIWVMATRSFDNVSPLHHQKLKGRRIVITERPKLHLLWIDDQVFLKPLPLYLLSYDFWQDYLIPSSSAASLNQKPHEVFYSERDAQKQILTTSALGFLRTYRYLIQYKSDFDIAVAEGLVPASMTFDSFCRFSSRFEAICDADVNPRYSYGELRLGRLNLWCKIFLRQWHYQTIHRQYAQYFARFYGPLLFMFGFWSVLLSAAQLEMAVENQYQTANLLSRVWPQYWSFSRIISVLGLVMVGLPFTWIMLLLGGTLVSESRYFIKHWF